MRRRETMDPEFQDLNDPVLYINRDLSLLGFNQRVLAQAMDASLPILERLRFLTISSTNLDEFFEVRVASHRERARLGAGKIGADGLTSKQTLAAINDLATALVADQYRCLHEALLPALEEQEIFLLNRRHWSTPIKEWSTEYFRRQVLPVLTPIGLDPAHPFPRILNKSLNFIVSLEGDDAFGRDTHLAVVQVPRALPRIIATAPEAEKSDCSYVMLSAVVHDNIEQLFPGLEVRGCYQFRVTRNGDLWVEQEDVDDLLHALKGELPERRYSEAVRLELTEECPNSIAEFLLDRFQLSSPDLYRVDGPVNLNRLDALYELIDRPDLKFPPFIPRIPSRFARGENVFDSITAGDTLLHHPYDSFQPVLELLRQAAADPDVLAIKQTLYRTGVNSPVVGALIDAARAGKHVTVVIELRARFDEADNIDFATQLQEVGANVAYGVVGYKTHAKMLLVVRREGRALKRYLHMSTGNYHPGTARAYTDLGFLTTNEAMGIDAHQIFNQLTGVGQPEELRELQQSPFTLHKEILELIAAESKRAQQGSPARIIAKMNALTEHRVIEELYRASQAGVEIDLIIRGACCLRPGVPGVSENIRVRSIIGRFLEHSRLYYFLNGGSPRLYCSSADWMSRNLKRRVETCFPIHDDKIQERLLHDDLLLYLREGIRAWELRSTGDYQSLGEKDAQELLLGEISRHDGEVNTEGSH